MKSASVVSRRAAAKGFTNLRQHRFWQADLSPSMLLMRDAKHLYGEGGTVHWFHVPDSREGWAEAIEMLETMTFQKAYRDEMLVIDFSAVREKNAPIMGMQGRPSSGPGPLMNALDKIAKIKGAGMKPWKQALYIDQHLAKIAPSRRRALMAVYQSPKLRHYSVMGQFIDLAGQRIGEWLILHRQPENYRGSAVWMCRCSCGVEKAVVSTRMRTGQSTSCGHSKLSAGGLSRQFESEYGTWRQMHLRCADPGHPRYKDWGARGIRVCERWANFPNFLSDMGPRPFPHAQIDRIDNDDGYYPENCEWVTPQVNAGNSSAVRILEHDGLSLSVAAWARRLEVEASVLYSRLHYGWSVERTLTQPVGPSTREARRNQVVADRTYASPRPRKRNRLIG